MANYKFRQPLYLMQDLYPITGLTVGKSHTQSASKIIFSSTCGDVVSSLSGTAGSVVFAASNVAVTDIVIVTAGCMPAKLFLTGACCLTADTITFKYYNWAAVSALVFPVSFDYIALG